MPFSIKRLARGEAKKWKSPGDAPASTRRDLTARHEAAHAVVAVRVGLPLTELHIQQRVIQGPGGEESLVNGITAVDLTAVTQWEPMDALERLLLFSAAPISMERELGTAHAAIACEHDIRALHEWFAPLDLSEAEYHEWFAWAVNTAAETLWQDDGDAWRLVSAELRRRLFLTPARVVGLIAESDARRAGRRTGTPTR